MEELARQDSRRPPILIFDITYAFTLSRIEVMKQYLHRAREIAARTVLFDGYAAHSLLAKMSEPTVEVAVIPYVIDSKKALNSIAASVMLVGPSYFVVSSEIESFRQKPKAASRDGNRILVTLGGADPARLTVVVMAALASVKAKGLDIRVVTGPFFSEDLIAEVRRQVEFSKHRCQLVNSPDTLVEHMLWCDLAITGPGLTKYELASLGIPMIIFTSNADDTEINKQFSSTGAAAHMCAGGDGNDPLVAQAIDDLVCNTSRQGDMARRGRELVDGKGAGRVVSRLLELEDHNG